jgi:predicted metal-dependent phosphoesterase TrpH
LKHGRERLQLKIDLHVHSYYSADSSITPEELVFYAKKRGLDGVAVTDHESLDGALKIAKEADFLVVPGMEVGAVGGHIVGLGLRQPVPSHLGVDETVDRIHRSGGIAVACHPTGFLKGGLGSRVSSGFDAVEVINSSAVPFGYSVRRNERIASALGKPRVAGSDAHYCPEIGLAYTLVNAESDVEEVVEAISKGLCQPFGRATPLGLRLRKMIAVHMKKSQMQK